MQTQEGPYNFMNAIHDHALHFFGSDYLDKEEKKPFDQRNTAVQWMLSYLDHKQELEQQGKNTEIEGQVGVATAWFRFCYDLYTIRDNSKLERRLKERLLSNRSFQSARYELLVAAICITAGFDIDFEDETYLGKTYLGTPYSIQDLSGDTMLNSRAKYEDVPRYPLPK